MLPKNFFISKFQIPIKDITDEFGNKVKGDDWNSDAQWIRQQLSRLPVSKVWQDKEGNRSSYSEYACKAYDYVWEKFLPDEQLSRFEANSWLRGFSDKYGVTKRG